MGARGRRLGQEYRRDRRAHAVLGLLPGVQRPALATAIPTMSSRAGAA